MMRRMDEITGVLRLKPREERRIKAGHLWIYADEVAHLEADGPGALAHVLDARGHALGTAWVNPESRIVGRMCSRKRLDRLGPRWWRERLRQALMRREWLFPTPHYRWVHGDGDRLSGLIVDRYGDDIVIQAHTAGIERSLVDIIDAVRTIASPRTIYLNNRTGSRRLDGLDEYVRVAFGDGEGWVTACEDGLPMRCHALEGQKTGYFYDQRPNRAWIQRACGDRRVLDLFAYVGAFAVQALKGGAREVVSMDASEKALALAGENVAAAGFAARWRGERADVMKALPELAAAGERFDVVISDPPAFAKSRASLSRGLRGYARLAEMTARLVAPGGMLALASCSGVVGEDDFRKACMRGIREAGRGGAIVHVGCAGADHPWQPAMPETRYLKFFVWMLD
ncbi:MAG: class I SAM-dependent rRNA methyltransferase [Mariprofundaceae bacterium]